jgi:hypothetical protein
VARPRQQQSSDVAWYSLPDDWGNPDQEAVQFPGFLGEWRRGEAQSSEQLGIHPKDVDRLIRELGLPLERSESAPRGAVARPARTVAGSSADLDSEAGALKPRSVSPVNGLSAEEAAERLEWERAMVEAGELRRVSPVLEHLMEQGQLTAPVEPASDQPAVPTEEGQHPLVLALEDQRASRRAEAMIATAAPGGVVSPQDATEASEEG